MDGGGGGGGGGVELASEVAFIILMFCFVLYLCFFSFINCLLAFWGLFVSMYYPIVGSGLFFLVCIMFSYDKLVLAFLVILKDL